MQNIRSEIQKLLCEAIKKAVAAGELEQVADEKVVVQYPPLHQENVCDYSSPIALALGKKFKKKPSDVAGILVKNLETPQFIGNVAIVEPGFINFKLSSNWLAQKIDDVIEEGNLFGTSNVGQGQTINLEFVSANPTGMPTFGNGRALFWADSLGRVLEKSGYAVTREYYINDVGNQVRIYGESILRRILQLEGIEVGYPENMYQGAEVKTMAKRVKEYITEEDGHQFTEKDLSDEAFLKKISKVSVEETINTIRTMIEEVCKVRFDVWTHEHVFHERGDVQKVLEDLKAKGETFEKDGALWFATTKYGDDKDRVLVRENGEVTYFVPDIAYHRDKFRRGFNVIADFWGADHFGYIPRMCAAMRALGEDVNRLKIVIAQMVHVLENGEQKKMSKRAGTSIPLNEMVQRAGLSASRYLLTSTALSSHMDFDIELAREQTDRNPVFYVQYAHVRLASIVRKSKEINVMDSEVLPLLGVSAPLEHPAEIALMRQIFRFSEVVEDVANSWEVQRLPHFAMELARAVHFFYDSVSVLNAETKELQSARLTLALAAKTTLGNLLDLLGVEKLEVM